MRLLALIAVLALAHPAAAGWVSASWTPTPGVTALRSGCVAQGQYERAPVAINGAVAGSVTIASLPDAGRCYFALNAGPQDEWFFDFSLLSGGPALPGMVRNVAITWAPTPPAPPAPIVTVTLNVNDPQNLDHVAVVVTGSSPVTLTLTGGQQWDWLKVGANVLGVGGTTVPTVPAIGGNQDGVQAAAITVTGPVNAVGDTDPGNFVGATAMVAGVTKALVKNGTLYSVSFP